MSKYLHYDRLNDEPFWDWIPIFSSPEDDQRFSSTETQEQDNQLIAAWSDRNPVLPLFKQGPRIIPNNKAIENYLMIITGDQSPQKVRSYLSNVWLCHPDIPDFYYLFVDALERNRQGIIQLKDAYREISVLFQNQTDEHLLKQLKLMLPEDVTSEFDDSTLLNDRNIGTEYCDIIKEKEQELPIGCVVEITDNADMEYEKKKVEIHSVYSFKGYLKFFEGSDEKAKRVFDFKMDMSLEWLKRSLKNKPYWSRLRWINVNGLETKSFIAIMEEFSLEPNDFTLDTSTFCREHDNMLCFKFPTYNIDKFNYSRGNIIKFIRSILSTLSLKRQPESLKQHKNQYPSLDELLRSNFSKHHWAHLRHFDHLNKENFIRKQEFVDNKQPLRELKMKVTREFCHFCLLKNSNTLITFSEHKSITFMEAGADRFTLDSKFKQAQDLMCHLLILFLNRYEDVIEGYKEVLSRTKIELLNNATSTEKLHMLHLMCDELFGLQADMESVSDNLEKMARNAILSQHCKAKLCELEKDFKYKIQDVERMTTSIENLINLSFNTTSTQTNNSMAVLAIVSLIFLPLGFWTSYFGMNFPSIAETTSSVSQFWAISGPFTVALVILSIFRTISHQIEIAKNNISDWSAQVRDEYENIKKSERSTSYSWEVPETTPSSTSSSVVTATILSTYSKTEYPV